MSKGCHLKTCDAEDMFVQMNQARKDCLIPSYMVPWCSICGGNMAMYLRSDQYFVGMSTGMKRLNLEEAFIPDSFGKRAVGINEDIARSICDLGEKVKKDSADAAV